MAAAGKRIGLSDQYYICPVYHGEGPPERDEINAELLASLGLKIVMVTKAKYTRICQCVALPQVILSTTDSLLIGFDLG